MQFGTTADWRLIGLNHCSKVSRSVHWKLRLITKNPPTSPMLNTTNNTRGASLNLHTSCNVVILMEPAPNFNLETQPIGEYVGSARHSHKRHTDYFKNTPSTYPIYLGQQLQQDTATVRSTICGTFCRRDRLAETCWSGIGC